MPADAREKPADDPRAAPEADAAVRIATAAAQPPQGGGRVPTVVTVAVPALAVVAVLPPETEIADPNQGRDAPNRKHQYDPRRPQRLVVSAECRVDLMESRHHDPGVWTTRLIPPAPREVLRIRQCHGEAAGGPAWTIPPHRVVVAVATTSATPFRNEVAGGAV